MARATVALPGDPVLRWAYTVAWNAAAHRMYALREADSAGWRRLSTVAGRLAAGARSSRALDWMGRTVDEINAMVDARGLAGVADLLWKHVPGDGRTVPAVPGVPPGLGEVTTQAGQGRPDPANSAGLVDLVDRLVEAVQRGSTVRPPRSDWHWTRSSATR